MLNSIPPIYYCANSLNRYSFDAARKNPRVIEELGDKIIAPTHITLKKRRRNFQMQYKIKGNNGTRMTVKATATIDPERDFIDAEAFKYIIARKEELSLRRNPLTDLINRISMAVGDTSIIKSGDIDKQRDIENRIIIVDNQTR